MPSTASLDSGVLDDAEEEDGFESYDEDDGDSWIMWTGYGKKTPILLFRTEAVSTKYHNEAKDIGEKYRMSYKMVRTESRLVRNIITSHGFHETHPNSNEFSLMWTGGHVKPYTLKTFNEFQKVNHFPRSYEITRKDRLYKNIQRMQQLKGHKNFDYVPLSFVTPGEFTDFCAQFVREKGVWIVKPIASSRGRGISVVNHPDHIPLDETMIVSRYIANPLLVDGFKFDVRLYVAVTSYDPLVIYLYEEGLVRFATVQYDRSVRTIKNTCMHLTNYSLNKKSNSFVQNEDSEVEDYGNKWSLGALLRHLKEEGRDTVGLMMRIEDVVIKTIVAGEMQISSACKMFVPHRANCFEVYGFDILVDEGLKPWLLEVNLSPSLACDSIQRRRSDRARVPVTESRIDSPLDGKIKYSLICDLFSLVGFVLIDPSAANGRSRAPTNYWKSLEHLNSPVSKKYKERYRLVFGEKPRNEKGYPKRPSSASRGEGIPRSATSIGLSANSPTTRTDRPDSSMAGLTGEQIKILRRVREEAVRKGGFIRIFPAEHTWELYGQFLQNDKPGSGATQSNNHMLHDRLYASRRAINHSANARNAAQMRVKVLQLYQSPTELNGSMDAAMVSASRRSAKYERQLSSVDSRRRRAVRSSSTGVLFPGGRPQSTDERPRSPSPTLKAKTSELRTMPDVHPRSSSDSDTDSDDSSYDKKRSSQQSSSATSAAASQYASPQHRRSQTAATSSRRRAASAHARIKSGTIRSDQSHGGGITDEQQVPKSSTTGGVGQIATDIRTLDDDKDAQHDDGHKSSHERTIASAAQNSIRPQSGSNQPKLVTSIPSQAYLPQHSSSSSGSQAPQYNSNLIIGDNPSKNLSSRQSSTLRHGDPKTTEIDVRPPSPMETNKNDTTTTKRNERRMDLVRELKRGAILTQVQARTAFAAYLKRVRDRLGMGAKTRSGASERDLATANEQMDLVIRFLKRAASNLQTEDANGRPSQFRVIVPSRRLPVAERKKLLAKQLHDFVQLYVKETDVLEGKLNRLYGANAIYTDKPVDVELFREFVQFASEIELEDVLTTYTRIQKSASIFLNSTPVLPNAATVADGHPTEKATSDDETTKSLHEVPRESSATLNHSHNPRHLSRDMIRVHSAVSRHSSSQFSSGKQITDDTGDVPEEDDNDADAQIVPEQHEQPPASGSFSVTVRSTGTGPQPPQHTVPKDLYEGMNTQHSGPKSLYSEAAESEAGGEVDWAKKRQSRSEHQIHRPNENGQNLRSSSLDSGRFVVTSDVGLKDPSRRGRSNCESSENVSVDLESGVGGEESECESYAPSSLIDPNLVPLGVAPPHIRGVSGGRGGGGKLVRRRRSSQDSSAGRTGHSRNESMTSSSVAYIGKQFQPRRPLSGRPSSGQLSARSSIDGGRPGAPGALGGYAVGSYSRALAAAGIGTVNTNAKQKNTSSSYRKAVSVYGAQQHIAPMFVPPGSKQYSTGMIQTLPPQPTITSAFSSSRDLAGGGAPFSLRSPSAAEAQSAIAPPHPPPSSGLHRRGLSSPQHQAEGARIRPFSASHIGGARSKVVSAGLQNTIGISGGGEPGSTNTSRDAAAKVYRLASTSSHNIATSEGIARTGASGGGGSARSKPRVGSAGSARAMTAATKTFNRGAKVRPSSATVVVGTVEKTPYGYMQQRSAASSADNKDYRAGAVLMPPPGGRIKMPRPPSGSMREERANMVQHELRESQSLLERSRALHQAIVKQVNDVLG